MQDYNAQGAAGNAAAATAEKGRAVLDAAGAATGLVAAGAVRLAVVHAGGPAGCRPMALARQHGLRVKPAMTAFAIGDVLRQLARAPTARPRPADRLRGCRRPAGNIPKEREMTRVADVMTRGVRSMSPQDTVVLAAQAMDELNVGVIPVCEGDKLVGMVTDRDIVVRGVAQEADTTSMRLADVMSTNVRCATEDEDVDEVLDEMARSQIRRMPVVDRKEHLVGIITLGDIAAKTRTKRWMWPIRWAISPSRPRRTAPASPGPAAPQAAAVHRATPEGHCPTDA